MLEEAKMEVLHSRCAGLDVHKDTVVAAVRLTEGDGVGPAGGRDLRDHYAGAADPVGLAGTAWLSQRRH